MLCEVPKSALLSPKNSACGLLLDWLKSADDDNYRKIASVIKAKVGKCREDKRAFWTHVRSSTDNGEGFGLDRPKEVDDVTFYRRVFDMHSGTFLVFFELAMLDVL